ncbi:uncharacterized protein V6R79_019882 [Siganus canaliculatus]
MMKNSHGRVSTVDTERSSFLRPDTATLQLGVSSTLLTFDAESRNKLIRTDDSILLPPDITILIFAKLTLVDL